jgi:hypothetical protein
MYFVSFMAQYASDVLHSDGIFERLLKIPAEIGYPYDF